MSARRTGATAARVLTQLRHDPRTVLLVLLVPAVLLTLVRGIFDGRQQTLDRIGVPMMGVFPLTTMFLVASITMLRERSTGTLERLMTLPIAKLDLLAGYALAFGLVATAQVSVVLAVGLGPLGFQAGGSWLLVLLVAVLNALLGMALGLFLSAFATTEFQAVQFMPAVIFPQLLLCGLFAPRETMAPALEAISDVLPLTYAFDALQSATAGSSPSGETAADIAVVVGFAALALALGALTLRRRTD